MSTLADDLRPRIREDLIMSGSGPALLTHWQTVARSRGLSPLEAAFFVSDVAHEVQENQPQYAAIANKARTVAARQANNQLTPDDANTLILNAQSLGLSPEFVRDRWLPTLVSLAPASLTVASIAPPEVAPPAPEPAPAPIVIDWLLPANPPETPVSVPVSVPVTPAPTPPVSVPLPPVAPVVVAVAAPVVDLPSDLSEEKPARKPFLETTGGIVLLATLVTALLIGGILYAVRPGKTTDPARISAVKSYRPPTHHKPPKPHPPGSQSVTTVTETPIEPIVPKPVVVKPNVVLPYDQIKTETGQYGERAAQKNGKWGLWQGKKWLIQPVYDDISVFRERRATVYLGGQTYDIDRFGSRIRDEN